jgi:hypothetical protein
LNRFSFNLINEPISGFADIKVSNNDRFVVQSQFIYKIGSVSNDMGQYNYNVVGTQTVSSITKLTIQSANTNGIGVGSKFTLYKVTEAA